MQYKKILIIRFSSIGDVVLTTPIVRSIKKQTGAELHYLIKPSFIQVIRDNPYIDQIHQLDERIGETIKKLKNQGFDLIVDLQKNLKSYRIARELGAETIRFDKLNIRKWLAVRLKLKTLPPNKHLVDRYFDALATLGIKDDGHGMDYFILPEDEYDAQELVRGFHYQVLVLGATYFTKRIPKEKCEDIISMYKSHTVLIGGKDVAALADELSTAFPEKVINFCGKIGLGVSAAIVKHATEVVTGDTGMMHIAAALQKKITVLWGNTIPDFGMYPYYGHKNTPKYRSLEVENLSCRPCSKLGYNKCPKGHFKCMNDIQILPGF